MIVHVLGRFPPPIDGQTIATRRMADLLVSNREVRRINTEPPASEFVENEVTLRWTRVRHYVALRSKIRDEFSRAPDAPVLWASISPAPLGHWRDVVTVLPAFPRNQPVAGVVHRSGYDARFRSVITYPSAAMLVRRLSAFVFLNHAASDACARWIPPKKRFVIPNTIDASVSFSEADLRAKRSRRQERDYVRILFLSNMIPLKGYLDVARAARVLNDQKFSFRMDFVGRWGSDDDRRQFEQVIDDGRLGDVVTYHGGVDDRERVKSFYRDADVFALPSYHPTEAQPVALIEAMNAGLPIITTRQGGIPTMFDNGGAIFVPSRSPHEIAEAIESLTDPSTWNRYSEASRDTFERRFSETIVTRMWESLLDSICAE